MHRRRIAVGLVLGVIAVGSLSLVGPDLPGEPFQDDESLEGTYRATAVPQAEVLEEVNSSSTETVVVLQWSAINETQDPTLLGTILERASANGTAGVDATAEQTREITDTLEPFLPAEDDVSVVLFIEYEDATYRLTASLEI